MAKTVIHIKDSENKYSLDKVGCFERPTALILGALGSDDASFYLMFRKLFQVYTLDIEQHSDYHLDEKSSDVWIFDRLGLTRKWAAGPLKDAVAELIASQTPVLVPGNLREIYFSDHYKSGDWPHLFLVNGYDGDNELFYVLDYIQNKNVSELMTNTSVPYDKCILRADDLEAAYRAYTCFHADLSVQYFEKQDKFDHIDKRELLLAFLELLRDRMESQQFIERPLSAAIRAEIAENSDTGGERVTDLLQTLSKSPKYREVMMTETLRLLRQYPIHAEAVHEMETLKEAIVRSWALIAKKFYRDLLKGAHLNDMDISEAMRWEREFYDLAYTHVSGVLDPALSYEWGSI